MVVDAVMLREGKQSVGEVIDDDGDRSTMKGARATVVRYSELLQLVMDSAKKHQMSASIAERLAKTLVDG